MSKFAGTVWEGVALTRRKAGADPDARPRPIALPLCWDGLQNAAAALAALAPGNGPVSLPTLAEGWIGRVLQRGLKAGVLSESAAPRLGDALRTMVLARRGAPGVEVWCGENRPDPRFVLNLTAFLEAEGGFDAAGYAEACALAVRALDCLTSGKATRLRVGFADLAGLLAGLGLAYGSADARAVAAAVAALTRGAAEAESGRLAGALGAKEPAALLWPAPPAETAIPGLAAAARAAMDAASRAPGLRHGALVSLAPADAVEAMLGVESAGLSPAAGTTRPEMTADGGIVEVPTQAALRAGMRAAELLAPVDAAARSSLRHAVLPFLHAAPPEPVVLPAPPRAAESGKARRFIGSSLHASVGGHKVVLRTTEDAEGKLQEIAFSLSKEGAAYRSLMDAFAQAVSLGLQHGVPLERYVETFAYTRFGPSGAVEGDPAIAQATSVSDWAFRRLALDYLGRRDLPDPSEEDCAGDAVGPASEQAPLLPMDLPEASPRQRRRSLRLVG